MNVRVFGSAIMLLFTDAEVAHASFLPVSTSFTTGFEGWTPAGPSTTYVSTGGNNGGYIRHVGWTFSGRVDAPTSYHGDWTSLGENGVLRMDAIVEQVFGGIGGLFWITVSGVNGSARWDIAINSAGGGWQTFEISLTDSSAWTQINGISLGAVLSSVDSVSVFMPTGPVSFVGGLDNFTVKATDNPTLIPLPATGGLAIAGSLLLGGVRRRWP